MDVLDSDNSSEEDELFSYLKKDPKIVVQKKAPVKFKALKTYQNCKAPEKVRLRKEIEPTKTLDFVSKVSSQLESKVIENNVSSYNTCVVEPAVKIQEIGTENNVNGLKDTEEDLEILKLEISDNGTETNGNINDLPASGKNTDKSTGKAKREISEHGNGINPLEIVEEQYVGSLNTNNESSSHSINSEYTCMDHEYEENKVENMSNNNNNGNINVAVKTSPEKRNDDRYYLINEKDWLSLFGKLSSPAKQHQNQSQHHQESDAVKTDSSTSDVAEKPDLKSQSLQFKKTNAMFSLVKKCTSGFASKALSAEVSSVQHHDKSNLQVKKDNNQEEYVKEETVRSNKGQIVKNEKAAASPKVQIIYVKLEDGKLNYEEESSVSRSSDLPPQTANVDDSGIQTTPKKYENEENMKSLKESNEKAQANDSFIPASIEVEHTSFDDESQDINSEVASSYGIQGRFIRINNKLTRVYESYNKNVVEEVLDSSDTKESHDQEVYQEEHFIGSDGELQNVDIPEGGSFDFSDGHFVAYPVNILGDKLGIMNSDNNTLTVLTPSKLDIIDDGNESEAIDMNDVLLDMSPVKVAEQDGSHVENTNNKAIESPIVFRVSRSGELIQCENNEKSPTGKLKLRSKGEDVQGSTAKAHIRNLWKNFKPKPSKKSAVQNLQFSEIKHSNNSTSDKMDDTNNYSSDEDDLSSYLHSKMQTEKCDSPVVKCPQNGSAEETDKRRNQVCSISIQASFADTDDETTESDTDYEIKESEAFLVKSAKETQYKRKIHPPLFETQKYKQVNFKDVGEEINLQHKKSSPHMKSKELTDKAGGNDELEDAKSVVSKHIDETIARVVEGKDTLDEGLVDKDSVSKDVDTTIALLNKWSGKKSFMDNHSKEAVEKFENNCTVQSMRPSSGVTDVQRRKQLTSEKQKSVKKVNAKKGGKSDEQNKSHGLSEEKQNLGNKNTKPVLKGGDKTKKKKGNKENSTASEDEVVENKFKDDKNVQVEQKVQKGLSEITSDEHATRRSLRVKAKNKTAFLEELFQLKLKEAATFTQRESGKQEDSPRPSTDTDALERSTDVLDLRTDRKMDHGHRRKQAVPIKITKIEADSFESFTVNDSVKENTGKQLETFVKTDLSDTNNRQINGNSKTVSWNENTESRKVGSTKTQSKKQNKGKATSSRQNSSVKDKKLKRQRTVKSKRRTGISEKCEELETIAIQKDCEDKEILESDTSEMAHVDVQSLNGTSLKVTTRSSANSKNKIPSTEKGKRSTRSVSKSARESRFSDKEEKQSGMSKVKENGNSNSVGTVEKKRKKLSEKNVMNSGELEQSSHSALNSNADSNSHSDGVSTDFTSFGKIQNSGGRVHVESHESSTNETDMKGTKKYKEFSKSKNNERLNETKEKSKTGKKRKRKSKGTGTLAEPSDLIKDISLAKVQKIEDNSVSGDVNKCDRSGHQNPSKMHRDGRVIKSESFKGHYPRRLKSGRRSHSRQKLKSPVKRTDESWKELLDLNAFKFDFDDVKSEHHKPVNVKKLIWNVMKSVKNDDKEKMKNIRRKRPRDHSSSDLGEKQRLLSESDDAWFSDSGPAGSFPGIQLSDLSSQEESAVEQSDEVVKKKSHHVDNSQNLSKSKLAKEKVQAFQDRSYIEFHHSPEKESKDRTVVSLDNTDTSSENSTPSSSPDMKRTVDRLKCILDKTSSSKVTKNLKFSKLAKASDS